MWVLETEKLSKWYGEVLGLNHVDLQIGPGIQGLLGPNGAGKSTLIKLAVGLLAPSLGSVRVLGETVYRNVAIRHQIGYCPEVDAIYPQVTGLEWMIFLARMYRLPRPLDAARSALEQVGLLDAADRRVKAYSLGMRQRLKLAGALIHDPRVFFLDEPLRGIDPLWRLKVMDLIRTWARDGRTVFFSSHVLPEVETLTREITLIHQGKIFARGDLSHIRDLLDQHPHKVTLISPQAREWASELVRLPAVVGVRMLEGQSGIEVETRNRDLFYERVSEWVLGDHLPLEEMRSGDDNLQAVFDYLVSR